MFFHRKILEKYSGLYMYFKNFQQKILDFGKKKAALTRFWQN